MNNLSAFLNPAKEENRKAAISTRFTDEQGKPVEWELRALTGEEDETIRKQCTKRVQMPGNKGQYTQETDYNDYLGKLAAACVVFPPLSSKELQDSYGALGADTLLKKLLKPGEYASLIEIVQNLNGFDISTGELVETAKN